MITDQPIVVGVEGRGGGSEGRDLGGREGERGGKREGERGGRKRDRDKKKER